MLPAFYVSPKLFLGRCANRARVCARTAANALVSIDYVFAVALGNATGGARVCTCTTADALVGNLVCHSDIPPF